MKKILLSLSILISAYSYGQISGTSVFLQGQYVEVGINGCGVYGSHEEPPVGPYGAYHVANANGLGYVADSEMDGWDVHTDPDAPVFCGDYFTPGSPEEGWAIQYGDNVYENHSTYCSGYGEYAYLDSTGNIPGSNTFYSDSAGMLTAIWEGSLVDGDLDLSVKQITTLADTALFFISTIEITNNGATDLTDLYYIRNVDPDQDLDHCGTFATYNSILSNTPASDTVIVTAIGSSCGCYFGTTAVDPRARVSYGAFFLSPNTPFDAYHGLGDVMPYYLEGEDYWCDCSVQITYKFDLPAGATTSLSYARMFGESATENAQQALIDLNEPVISADGAAVVSDGSVMLCEGQSMELSVDGPAGYTWTWEPADYLDSGVGSNVISTPSADITYTVTGTDGTNTVNTSVSIQISEAIVLNMESTPSVDGAPTGTATASIEAGGLEPFTYEWSNGATTPVIAGLDPGTYIVWVTDAAGCTATQSIVVSLANDLQSVDASGIYSLFPNPATDQLNLELADWVTNAIIEVVTVNGGEVMLNQSVQEQLSTFDVSTWHPGVYLVKVCTAAGCFGQTILVQ